METSLMLVASSDNQACSTMECKDLLKAQDGSLIVVAAMDSISSASIELDRSLHAVWPPVN